MYFNVLNYYDVYEIVPFIDVDKKLMYTIEMTSKSTGEIMDITVTDELFDIILEEMEVNLMYKKMKLAQIWSYI